MTLTFSSSSPATSSVNFFVNKSLTVTFNESLDSDYVDARTVLLYDITAGLPVPATVQISATDDNTIVVIPTATLKENSNFRLVIVGTDQSVGTALQAANGDILATSVKIVFATGESTYSIDSTVEKEAGQLSLEGDLFLPTNVKALGYNFTLEKVRPQNRSALTGALTGVTFTFTKSLLTGQDLSTWVDVNVFSLLDDAQYLAVNNVLGSGVSIPSYSLTATGRNLSIFFNTEVPQNVAVTARLHNSIKSVDGDYFGADYEYSAVTKIFPAVYSVHVIKSDLNALANQLNDDYVATLLFKNAIFLWEGLGRSFNLSALPYAAQFCIYLDTLIDIMDDQDYKKFLVAGSRRQLGDLNVSVDNIIGRLALKISRTEKDREVAFETLVKGWQFRVSPYVTTSSFQGTRLWYDVNYRRRDSSWKYYQPNLPIANIAITRQAKTSNPLW